MFDPVEAQNIVQAKGFKISKGWRLIIPYEFRGNRGEARQYFYRHGLSREAHRWLKENVGKSCTYAEWEFDPECKGRWLYTGSQQRKATERGACQETITLWFRDKGDAMLFKLRWFSKL